MKLDRKKRETPDPADLEAQVRAHEKALGITKAELATARALVAERSTELVTALRKVKELEAVHGPAPRPAEEAAQEAAALAAQLDAFGFDLVSARFPVREIVATGIPGRFEAQDASGNVIRNADPAVLVEKAKAKAEQAALQPAGPAPVAVPHVDRPYPDSEAAPVTAEGVGEGPRVLRGTVSSGPEGMSR